MDHYFQRRLDFDKARLLVIGDVMLDRFCYGSVSRISPEAPVPVVHVTRHNAMLGGAGNVLANVAALDARCGLIAVIGDDEAGRHCREQIAALGCDPALLVVAPGRMTTVKTRYISGSQQLLRCDEEDISSFAPAVEDEIIARIDRVIASYGAVAISDYAKGVLSDRVLAHIFAASRRHDIPVAVDPKRRDLTAYRGATIIKPNRQELAAFSHRVCGDLATCQAAAEQAMVQTGAAILLTLSEDGMALFRPEQAMAHYHATATEVFDVSGAGDTALAILCVAIASGLDMEEAAMLANAGAGAVVRKLGTATVSQAELIETVGASEPFTPAAICNRRQAQQQVALWKGEGLRVGFTNGCFDILHAGHIEILRQSRARCDRLVVGLNSDASVNRLKGPTRPIQPESSRAQVLSAIDVVDLVVVFDEDTPLQLIRALIPTDLVKGADYTEDQVVGAREVKAAGGRVHLIELVPGLSTTRAVDRIRDGLVAGHERALAPELASRGAVG